MTLFPAQYATAPYAAFYTNGGSNPVIVDKLMARNNDTASQMLQVYLVSFGDTPSGMNLFFSESIAPGKSTMCPTLVGSELAPGDALWIGASVAGMIAVHANGRERLS